jgi:hypothetical protein
MALAICAPGVSAGPSRGNGDLTARGPFYRGYQGDKADDVPAEHRGGGRLGLLCFPSHPLALGTIVPTGFSLWGDRWLHAHVLKKVGGGKWPNAGVSRVYCGLS